MMKKMLLILLMLGSYGPALMARCCTTTGTNNCSSNCGTSCSNSCDDCKCDCAGKTYLFVRPMFQSVRPELISGFRNDRMIAASEHCWNGAFEVAAFGGSTTNGNSLARYFLPNCKNGLSVVNVPEDEPVTSDLYAENFNIFTLNGDFASTVSFKARHSEVGVGFQWKQGFWFNDDRTKWWYLHLNFPVTQVRNKMEICEKVTNDGGGIDTASSANAVANMTQAFKQPAWKFGRIDNCTHSKTGVADIELKLGYQWLARRSHGEDGWWGEHCNIASYLGVLIPTGNTPKGCNVFEPIVGHGKHVGVMWGAIGGFNVWNSCEDAWHLDLDFAVHSQYLFKKKQVRSFDLKGKPWSRYIAVYENLAQAQAAANLLETDPLRATTLNTPGINVLTQCVNVKPGFFNNMTSSVLLSNNCGFQAELGWNLYLREQECLDLNWKTGPAITQILEGAGNTDPIRDITPNTLLIEATVPLADYNNSLIQKSDIDIQSAASPAALAYLVYGSLGYRLDDMCLPVHFNVGASYEFTSRTHSMLNRWGVWGKVGFAY